MKKVLKITGNWDGNIFSIIGNTRRALRDAGRQDLVERVMEATKMSSYHEALGHCMKLLEEAGYKVR